MAKKSVVINISLSDIYLSRVKELSKKTGLSISEIFRRGFDMHEKEYNAEKFGRYKGTEATKLKLSRQEALERREEQIAWVRSADGPALTAYLIDCGYIEQPEFEQGDLIVRIVAEPNDAGILMLRQRFFNKATKEFSYASDLQTIEEVVKGLIKEKRI